MKFDYYGNNEATRENIGRSGRNGASGLEIAALAASVIALFVSVGTLTGVITISGEVSNIANNLEECNEAIEAIEKESRAYEGESIEGVTGGAVSSSEEDGIIAKALAHDTLTSKGEYAYNPENNMIETWYSSRVMKFPEYKMKDWTVGADGAWRDKDGYVVACAPSFGTDDIDGDDAEKMADKSYVKAYELGEEISTTFGAGKVYDLSPAPCVLTDEDGMRYGFMSVYTGWYSAK